MNARQTFDAELAGGFRYTVQLQPDRRAVDFNVYVHDSSGKLVAEDSTPAAGAECSFDAIEGGRFRITVELARGAAGFSINVASRPLRQTAPTPQPRPRPGRRPRTGRRPSTAALSKAPPAASTGSALTPDEAEELVDAHNEWRARFGVAPLRWSNELAAVAQEWADHLAATGMQMRHRSPNDHGENIYWCSGRAADPDDVVDAWGNEVELYDEAANNWWPKAGHFSQVVWHSTTEVGGAVARVGGQEMWVCNYAPRGNWSGQRPYPI